MSEIVEFRSIADEITIRGSDGVAIVSIRGAARLAGVSAEAISKSLRSVNQKPSAMAEKLMAEGFESVNLVGMAKDGIPDEALEVILHYYAFDAGPNCRVQAKHSSRQFSKVGVRAVCYAAKGLVLGSSNTRQQPQSVAQIEAAKGVVELIRLALQDVTLGNTPEQSESLKAGAALSAVQQIAPSIAPAIEPTLKLLAATNTSEVVYMTPTRIGERLGMSARAVNAALIGMELQHRNEDKSKGAPSYLPSDSLCESIAKHSAASWLPIKSEISLTDEEFWLWLGDAADRQKLYSS